VETAKERARIALIRRINDFKPDETVSQVIDELLEEIWGIFENDHINSIIRGREIKVNGQKANVKKSTYNIT